MNPSCIYINSLVHFAKEKHTTKDGIPYTIRYYLLDKRFLKETSTDYLEAILSRIKIKDLDNYYYEIVTLQYINNQKLYYTLDKYNLLISLSEFCSMLGRSY